MQIFGIKYGLRGFYDRATKPVHLTPETVDGIQLRGGTILVRCPGFIVVCGLCGLRFLCTLETTTTERMPAAFLDSDPHPCVAAASMTMKLVWQGTSRGGADVKEIVKRVKLWGVNQLYVVGGNGGNAAANAIQKECEAQAVLCSVVGIPKSIDNDILLVTSLLRICGTLLMDLEFLL